MTELEEIGIHINSIENTEQIISQLMDNYSDDVLHLVFSYVKNRTTAEDLTQEIFIKCYEKLDQFNNKSSIKTWLYRIAINHCKDYLGSWHYRKLNFNDKIWDYLPSKSKHVEEEIISKDVANSLMSAVMDLPVKYREVVFLHYYEELPLANISKITGVNSNTLKTRLKQARELLKNKMKKEV
ncbi:sigma-70 family RNA polymerase sigma factor [Listeria monocytogenes]|uniref:Sigma-70 family RNA polymerase sigma factor n=2 Tax=Bacteria TaxID=2 RepID=A0A5M3ELT5_LISMN|nr:sigma-70 family RNA polymerase sigma factor [Listeria monocytogenes]EDH0937651.1 sigma-70 family RNA polymerase sigma factor [Listeria monocytogenes]EDO1215937.1 sigma-70 family RNA polymerase sigma factor [Listeria monocytogenes]EDP7789627.1 sigma-70 family RNA polymerase sigma factor [Listeria monocytogenes]EIL5476697.1 sigma-70 family RNA polymerase sigma factor [Listeria monocytogenes]